MKKKMSGLIGIFAAVLMLAGCGDSGASARSESTKEAYSNGAQAYWDEEADWADDYDMVMADAAGSGTSYAGPEQPEVAENAQSSKRKLIRNVNMSVETKSFDDFLRHLEQRTKELGGYIENSYSYNGSRYSGQGRSRNANMTIRIPAQKLDEFLSDVSGSANVISRNENVNDVTLQYVDMESHRNALRAEEERLIQMMDKAETIEDLITIESRLSDIRYQLESMESQLRTYDNLVDYSTLSLDITEVEDLTPVVEQTAWEKMGSGFMNSLSSIGRGFKNFGIAFVMNIPYILLWGVIILVIFLISRSFIRKMIRKAGYGRTTTTAPVNGNGAAATVTAAPVNGNGAAAAVTANTNTSPEAAGKKEEKAPENMKKEEEKK